MSVEQRLQRLEAELQRLSDIEAIRQLKARYLNACDRQDPEAVRDCFVAGEVIIDMAYFGQCSNRDEFVDGIFVPRGCHDYVLDMHHCANPEIDILSEDSARGVWSLNYRNINTRDQTLTLMSALYHDEYRREAGQWKVSRSRTEYRTVLHCSYQPGTLEVETAARSLGG
ncbi:nuclear transport factor 2 family protein [Seongchinamella sediminis]|uniref:Nuclear transport factor 2 family protein n=1 Tax=Seongchinamella sediminis TaxID=2283635 RepID=A0A3L7DZP7_9GAMM|nr:nuclear transport factor 2 family protein [Seongchinamella sediminis]RLQ23067.1 nuclear transport factor 2 family protein [Seongchinamella sediminis]